MKPVRRLPARLSLERLEQRDCPSLTVTLYGGSLNVSGTPTGALAVTEATPGKLTVMDGTHFLGTYSVGGDLRLSLASHPNTVNVDLGGNTFAGNVLISLGNGDPASHEVSVSDGTVRGNVTFLGGSGKETESLGFPAFAPVPVNVRGSVQATGRVSGGGDAGPGDTLFVGPGSSVGGDVSTTQIDNVAVGQPGLALTTVGGNVTVNDSGAGAALLVNVFGNVGKGVSVTGTAFDDAFVLQQASPGVGGNVAGGLSVDLGGGATFGNSFLLDAGTTVGASATLTSGASAGAGSVFTVNGTVNGSLTANLGEGNDSFAFNASASVGGNLSVTGGNGNNTATAAGAVGGNLSFTFGSGNDSATVSSAPGGLLRWASGNGNDSLTLAPTAASAFNVNVLFGSGDDSFTLAGVASTISGTVNGGGGANVFTQDGWTIVPPWTLQNF